MNNSDYVKEYLDQMAELSEELSSQDSALTYKSIHAGQALIYSMAKDAKKEALLASEAAEVAREKAQEAYERAEEAFKQREQDPTLLWLLKNRPMQVIGLGLGAWMLIMVLYTVGVLPAVAAIFGIDLPPAATP